MGLEHLLSDVELLVEEGTEHVDLLCKNGISSFQISEPKSVLKM